MYKSFKPTVGLQSAKFIQNNLGPNLKLERIFQSSDRLGINIYIYLEHYPNLGLIWEFCLFLTTLLS